MAEVCTISKESLKKQEDDGVKGGVGEKIGRAKDKEDQTFLQRKEPSVFTVKIIVNICANIYDISRIALKIL